MIRKKRTKAHMQYLLLKTRHPFADIPQCRISLDASLLTLVHWHFRLNGSANSQRVESDFINNGKGLQPPNLRSESRLSSVRLAALQAHQAQGNAGFSRLQLRLPGTTFKSRCYRS